METSIIEIDNNDIVENLDRILEHSNIFKENSNLEAIGCYIFYVDDGCLFNYKKYEIQINDNKLTKNELMTLVLNNNKFYSKKYDLTGIYKFEVELGEDKIKDFCKNYENYNFLTSYNKIQDIHFTPVIELLSENNCIILFFSNTSQKLKNSSKEKSDSIKKISSKNKTKKRVKFSIDNNEKKSSHHSHNKTIKKGT